MTASRRTHRTSTAEAKTYREDLHNVVGGGPDGINVLLAEHSHEADSVRLQDPLLQGLELAILRDDDFLLVVSLRQVHVDLAKRRRATNVAICD